MSRPGNDTLFALRGLQLTSGIFMYEVLICFIVFFSLQAEDRSLHEKIIEIHEEYAALVVRSFVVIFWYVRRPAGGYSVPSNKPLIGLTQ